MKTNIESPIVKTMQKIGLQREIIGEDNRLQSVTFELNVWLDLSGQATTKSLSSL